MDYRMLCVPPPDEITSVIDDEQVIKLTADELIDEEKAS